MVTGIKPYNPGKTDLEPGWHVIDASGQTLGRLATEAAWVLMGKHRPTYVPHLASGDFVIVVNASEVRATGAKINQKVYVSHNQRPGHRKEIPYAVMLDLHPDRVVKHAVKGMLPKNKLGAVLLTRLKVYGGPEHKHSAQVIGAKNAALRAAAGPAGGAPPKARRPSKTLAAQAASAASAEAPAHVRRPRAPK